MGQERFKELDVRVFAADDQIVILGMPDEEDEEHNCDRMGCSSVEHVLYRFPIHQRGLEVVR